MAEAELYTTLEGYGRDEFEEKRSLFIGHAAPAKTEEEAMAFIKSKQKEFADATHNVWAYYIEGGIKARYSDDGEPQGSSGMPVLDTVRKSGVNDAVVVVTRYFGGTLLGVGGLVRAYSHAAKIALDAAHIITYERYSELMLECNYADYQKLSVELTQLEAIIDGSEFTDKVAVCFAVKKTLSEKLILRFSELTGGRCIPEITGERFDYMR
ncbi:MAG: YigZ family protein [Ruminococcaceae bacterium]|nr:YigZ family protein [Oscillospiraceae bacterium]